MHAHNVLCPFGLLVECVMPVLGHAVMKLLPKEYACSLMNNGVDKRSVVLLSCNKSAVKMALVNIANA